MASLVRVVSRGGKPSEKRYSLLDRLAGRDKPNRFGRSGSTAASRGAATQSAPRQQATKLARDVKADEDDDDDDDDSDDDEILSISSDEDDERGPSVPAMTPRTPAKWESSRALTRMGTRRYGALELGDGGEPASWDQVGEDAVSGGIMGAGLVNAGPFCCEGRSAARACGCSGGGGGGKGCALPVAGLGGHAGLVRLRSTE
ncbi:unnamed protein product [Closterium sp. NIES-54]